MRFRKGTKPDSAPAGVEPPMPPLAMRELIGIPDEQAFDDGRSIFVSEVLRPDARMLDFGCGCGRVARQLLRESPRPKAYFGLDLHPGMIRWCKENLSPLDPGFRFEHHDVEAPGLNPGPSKPLMLPFPEDVGLVDLVYAWSVFTHLRESQVAHYLRECERVLAPGGLIRTTWFLFDKSPFPMMQTFQHGLYINEFDPTNAVIFDRSWFLDLVRETGLVVSAVLPPAIRGFQWAIDLRRAREATEVPLPEDTAPIGFEPPPVWTIPPNEVV